MALIFNPRFAQAYNNLGLLYKNLGKDQEAGKNFDEALIIKPNYAEAANEVNGPTQEVYSMLNVIRERAGIKTVEEAWSDATIAATVNKHTTKDGLRDIIQHERLIELAFEGHRFFDMKRLGLDIVKAAPVQSLAFTDFRVLAPVPTREIQANPNIKQNTGY